MKRTGRKVILCVVGMLSFGACSNDRGAQAPSENREQGVGSSGAAALPNFTSLVAEHGDAVVNVDVVRQRAPSLVQQLPEDPFREFFRRFGIPMPEFGPRGQPAPMRGAGSGFIVSQGHVLTNAHVVADAEEVRVRLTDPCRDDPAGAQQSATVPSEGPAGAAEVEPSARRLSDPAINAAVERE